MAGSIVSIDGLHATDASSKCRVLCREKPVKELDARMRERPGKLPRVFYGRETLDVARDLIGMHVVHARAGTRRVGRIVETEAYRGPADLAAHSAGGRRTARTEVMYGPPGHAYVYLIYGFWDCLNVVTAKQGVPHAVLIRALEPIEGVTGTTHGPGLLCRTFAIDRTMSGMDLLGNELWIERPARRERRVARIGRSTRIGVEYAGEWANRPWRFFDKDSPYVSTLSAAARRRALAVTAQSTLSAGKRQARAY
jgi:DNA-3-methyladenine glycosylase